MIEKKTGNKNDHEIIYIDKHFTCDNDDTTIEMKAKVPLATILANN